VLTAFLALMATLGAAVVKGIYDTKLERQRFQSELVLRALQATSLEERVASLKFMVGTHLITDARIARSLDSVVLESKTNPAAVPQIAPAGATIPKPIVENARVFLLTGIQRNVPALDGLRDDLSKAGYSVLGMRVIAQDDSRPETPEVTYFNQGDSIQASIVAEILRTRFANSSLMAKRRTDPKVKPGYIEIWLGKH
jgi:hypothetical protein